MMFSKLLISFVFLAILIVIESRVFEDRHRETGEYEKENGLVIRESAYVNREKRGVFGFFVMTSLTAMTLASTGFTLAQALLEGCATRKNICKYRDAIEKIEKELEILGGKYDTIFRANQWKYLNLKTSMIDNERILKIIDDELNIVDDIGTRIEIITTNLEIDLETMNRMFSESNNSQHTANVFEKLVGPFEYQLEKIEENIKSLKYSQIMGIGLAIQRSVEVFFSGFLSYTNDVVKETKMTLGPDDNILNRVSSSNIDLPEQKQSFWRKTKYYFKSQGKKLGFSLKAIARDVRKKFGTTFPNNVKKWVRASKKWSTFKTQFKTSLKGGISKIRRIRHFFKSRVIKTKIAIKNYKFQPGQAFVAAIGLVMDTMNIIINEKQWAKVEVELSKAKTKYEQFLNNVKKALKELENETLTLDKHWSDTITSFKDLVNNFTNITNTARENEMFTDIFGLTGLPVDTSNPFFHTDFTQVTQKNIKSKQKIVIDFFRADGNSLSVLRDKFKIQQVLVSETKDLVLQEEPVSSIFDSLVRIYKNYDTPVLLDYSSKLVPRDVVCSTSLIFPNKTEYDCYPLDIFRSTKCYIDNATFANIEKEAAAKCDAVILHKQIQENVPKKTKPSVILDLAKSVYAASKEQRLNNYGNRLKEQNVVCEISVLYPTFDTYMLYDLATFRPDCSQVNDEQFQQMKADIVKMETAKSALGIVMNFCLDANQPCVCLSAMASSMKITVDQLHTLINEYKQEHKPNCEVNIVGTTCPWKCNLIP